MFEVIKQRIARLDATLEKDFWDGQPVEKLVTRRASFVDGLLTELWDDQFSQSADHALLAVGGYGRKELHPHSDIDLLVLLRASSKKTENVESFVRLLWDLGLEIGISVRTVRDCVENAREDITVFTALLERRWLCGSAELCQSLDRALGRTRIWSRRKFVLAKHEEQRRRHESFSDTEYDLEPDVKSSPGGLRDIQTIAWVAHRMYGSADLGLLTENGTLTSEEARTLTEGRSFLWRVRFALHYLRERREDQLSFEHQRSIAEKFGFKDEEGLLAVEQFMRDYYRHVLELREVNDIALQTVKENLSTRLKLWYRTQSLNERFNIRNGYIEQSANDTFSSNPQALMEIFVLMANTPKIQGVRANTIRAIRANLDFINDEFRTNSLVNHYFLTLLRSPYRVVSQLRRMRRYGVLGRYIPDFGRIIGQMQHDLMHVYTVDAHTMVLIRNLRRLFLPQYQQENPYVREAADQIDAPELLYLAGLFHDLGKGLGGNHSSLGAVSAREFCQEQELSEEDTELVEWLVQNHLLMSTTSQREDIDDLNVVKRFVNSVRTLRHLNYLLTLTVADIQATKPSLWNSWRAALLQQLYVSAKGVLSKTEAFEVGPENTQQSDQKKQQTAVLLEQSGTRNVNLDLLWEDTDTRFILHHAPATLAELAIATQNEESSSRPIVLTRVHEEQPEDDVVLDVVLCVKNRPGLLVDCFSAILHSQMSVLSARVITGESNYCYDTFTVRLQPHLKPSEKYLSSFRLFMSEVVAQSRKLSSLPVVRLPRQLRQFQVHTKVEFKPAQKPGRCRLELIAADRPGLLHLIAVELAKMNIEVHASRISTFGERAEDVFIISNPGEKPPISDAQKETIRQTLTAQIEAVLLRKTA